MCYVLHHGQIQMESRDAVSAVPVKSLSKLLPFYVFLGFLQHALLQEERRKRRQAKQRRAILAFYLARWRQEMLRRVYTHVTRASVPLPLPNKSFEMLHQALKRSYNLGPRMSQRTNCKPALLPCRRIEERERQARLAANLKACRVGMAVKARAL